MIKVGLFSDDRALLPVLSAALGKDFLLLHRVNEADIRQLASSRRIDVVILDFCSSQFGIEKRLESLKCLIEWQVPVVIMADESLHSKIRERVPQEPLGYCRRPPSIRDLKNLLTLKYETYLLKQQQPFAEKRFEQISGCERMIGSSPEMLGVYGLVRRVANLNASVLIDGESGTGKELIARAIHALSSRSGNPFVAISGGAIPETLIESELFGHVNGAFTGTVGPHEGYFEKAGEGTLFFDEIGELSLFTQVKLLRILQELEFSRLGSTRLIPLRARLIFATNRNLSKLVAEGKFRRDLYYRVNVMRIQAPALRDHAEDIPLMASHFIHHYCQIFGKQIDGIEPKAIELLTEHSWPGNVRELENVMQRAIIEAPGRIIRPEDLSLTCEEHDNSESGKVLNIDDYIACGSFEKQLREYKIKLALTAIRENNGNKALAARSLGMSRAYLYRLIGLAESELLDDETAICSKI